MNHWTIFHPAPPGGACQDSAPGIINNTGSSLPDHFRSRMLLHSGDIAHIEVRIHFGLMPSTSDAIVRTVGTEVAYD